MQAAEESRWSCAKQAFCAQTLPFIADKRSFLTEKKMKSIWLVAFVATVASPAIAQEIPQFDMHAHCKRISTLGESYSATLDKTCINMEQSAYVKLKSTWPTTSSRLRKHCREAASFGGPGSYTMLATCIEMETNEETENKKRAFKSAPTDSRPSVQVQHPPIPGG